MTTETTTLTEWLLEQLHEDERLSEVALHGDDHHPRGECFTCDETRDARALGAGTERWSADIEAKRRIVEMEESYEDAYVTAVRALATVYADRPGYREEWRP